MDEDIPSTHQPTLSTSESSTPRRLSSSPLSFSKKPDTPTPISQSRRRSPTRKASSIIVPILYKPPRKPRKQHQLATIDATSSQTTQSATPRQSAKEVKKPAMHVHRMLRTEVPGDATGVQVDQCFPLTIFVAQIGQYLECPQTTCATALGTN
jgi:hypothetical protein